MTCVPILKRVLKRAAVGVAALICTAGLSTAALGQETWEAMQGLEYRYDRFEDATEFEVMHGDVEDVSPGDIPVMSLRFWCDGNANLCQPENVVLCFVGGVGRSSKFEEKLIWLVNGERRLETTEEVDADDRCGSGFPVIRRLMNEIFHLKNYSPEFQVKTTAFRAPGNWIFILGEADALEFKIGRVTGTAPKAFQRKLSRLTELLSGVEK